MMCSYSSHTHTHTTVLLLFWTMSGTTRMSRYQKRKTRQWHLLGYMQCLLPSTSCKVSPCAAAGDTWVHLIPHSTHPQSSSLHGAVKAGSLSEIEKRALPPPCFPSFNFQSTRSQSELCLKLQWFRTRQSGSPLLVSLTDESH